MTTPDELAGKLATVQRLLAKEYFARGKPDLPPFEQTPVAVDVLHELLTEMNEADRNAKLQLAEMNQQIAEYRAEGERLDAILQSVGITPASLSQPGIANLHQLCSLAEELDCKDTDLSNLLLALIDRQRAARHAAEARAAAKRDSERIAVQSAAADTALVDLQKFVGELDADEAAQLAEQTALQAKLDYLERKSEEYRSTRAALKTELQRVGLTSDVTHGALLRLADEIAEIRAETEKTEALLRAYADLPPDLSLAEVQVAAARRQLQALEDEFQRRVGSMTLTD